MKVLVTGGAGFIGSHTVDLLLKKGYEVRIIDLLNPPVHLNKKKPKYVPEDVEFILGDVRSKHDLIKALEGIDAVIHLAAYQDYLTDFSTFANTNDVGTALLYEIIVNERIPVEKVILGSSQAVYGEGKYECHQHGIQYPQPRSLSQLELGQWEIRCPGCLEEMTPVLTDESVVNPHNQYAISKYAQELYALRLGQRYNIPTVALRYSITQGPRQSIYNAYSGILRTFTMRLCNNLPPIIYEDGKQLRDYVYVGDVAKVNLMALEDSGTNFEAYNVGGDKTVSVNEYANLLIRLFGKELESENKKEFRFGDTRHILSDISKIKNIGWIPSTPLDQIIRGYVCWLQKEVEMVNAYTEAEKVMKQQGVLRSTK